MYLKLLNLVHKLKGEKKNLLHPRKPIYTFRNGDVTKGHFREHPPQFLYPPLRKLFQYL